MKFKKTFLLIGAVLFLSSCTHKKVAVRRIDDTELSCGEIKREISETEKLRADITSKTGLSGRNVGMGLLFWPGIVVNQMNASDAEKLATERMNVLVNLYTKKRCSRGLRRVSFQKAK